MNDQPNIDWPNIERILIVGVTGSGKSTLARKLSDRTGLPHTELDELHWGPNWTKRPQFEEEALAVVARDHWIMDGGYPQIKIRSWPRADLVIWLDYRFLTVLRQLLVRIFARRWRNEVNFGNRESLRTQFFSRGSLFLWLFKTYRSRKHQHAELRGQHPDVPVLHFRRPADTDHWLGSVGTPIIGHEEKGPL